jgi:formate hydrogenlyase subunit 4
MTPWQLGALLLNLTLVPLLLVGVIRKTKALLQTRYGAPVWQPIADVIKLFRKGETVSDTASVLFHWAPRLGLALAWLTATLVPWAGALLPVGWDGATNLLLVLYLLALSKFLVLLAALDTGSAFGGLGASRETTLTVLVEPAIIIGLGALAVRAGTTDLGAIYRAPLAPLLAALVGAALLVAALAELSRMPVDDPTTHLELTMVHEAMILENSGRNLALVEWTVAVRTCLWLGLASQTLLGLWPGAHALAPVAHYGASLLAVFALGILVAVAEGVLVKLQWRSVPAFLAFATAASVLAAFVAVIS